MLFARSGLIGLIALVSVQLARADNPPATQPAKVQPVDFRKLKELMPDHLAGVKRSNIEGEKVSIGEFVMSKANAEYTKSDAGEKDPHLTIEIIDYGAAPGMAAAMSAWQNLQIDKESDSGYERTTKLKDQPAYETFQNEGKSGQLQVFVAGRFMMNVQTTNLSGDDLKKLFESLPVEKLAALK